MYAGPDSLPVTTSYIVIVLNRLRREELVKQK